MKKVLILLILLMTITGCQKKEEEEVTPSGSGCDIYEECTDPIDDEEVGTFKEKYESVNGTTTSSGAENRSVTIAEDHPFIKVKGSDIIKMIDNKETFYLYIGDEDCPWCRSCIEKAIEIAKEADVKTIYYIEIWNKDGDEIFRDQYKHEDGQLKQTVEGDEAYMTMLKLFGVFLEDYTLSDENDEDVEVGEKRIYVPNFFYIEDGVCKRETTGISEKQEGARDELTDEILADETALFKTFFAID